MAVLENFFYFDVFFVDISGALNTNSGSWFMVPMSTFWHRFVKPEQNCFPGLEAKLTHAAFS